MMYLAVSC